MSNKAAIMDCIIVYDALHKRSMYLDAIGKGLDVLKMIALFPEQCKPAFVSDGTISAAIVTSLLKVTEQRKDSELNDGEKRVWTSQTTRLLIILVYSQSC